jgi:hypothetical protein
MGVDYQVWIIPKQRSFRPNADQVANLANALREGRWVPASEAEGQRSEILELLPGGDTVKKKPARVHTFTTEPFTAAWIEFHSQHELLLNWSVNDQRAACVQYPFSFDPYLNSGSTPYFYVYVVLGHDYFCYTGETVMPIDEQSTRCACGEQLAFWTGYASGAPSQRIFSHCPKCSRDFDISGVSCDVQDGWTGKPSPLRGGLTFRFALIVNCHKYFPHDEEGAKRFHLRPEFLDLWRTHIGVPFEQIETWD